MYNIYTFLCNNFLNGNAISVAFAILVAFAVCMFIYAGIYFLAYFVNIKLNGKENK